MIALEPCCRKPLPVRQLATSIAALLLRPFFTAPPRFQFLTQNLREETTVEIRAIGCGILNEGNHAFVSRFIKAPYFGQAHAKLPCETAGRCLRARFGSCSGFLSPPAPRGADGPGHSFCASIPLHPAGSSPAFIIRRTDDRRQNEELAKLSSVLRRLFTGEAYRPRRE